MKHLFLLFSLFFSLTISSQINTKEIVPPSEGKSVIYFFRTSGYGGIMNFRYFDGKKYLGRFNGKNYMRYECEPGKKNFWLKAENIAVLEADLLPNKTYLVLTNASAGGFFTAAAKFRLVEYDSKAHVRRINRLLRKKKPKKFTQETLDEQLSKMQNAYKKGYKRMLEKVEKGKTKTLPSNSYLKF